MPELHFKGKEFVYNHHLTVPYRPLEPKAKKSIGKPSLNGNLIIQGDNLHALKALMPLYAGKVDCVFIDPPYNTGNENWAYNDNVNSPMMREWLSTNPVNKEDMLRHDKWLALMYPRFKLLHELLAETGSFWMTLDDNEIHRARAILDEIFGEEHFVATVIWQKKYSTKSDTRFLSEEHEYVLVYAKDISRLDLDGLERTEEQDANYKNPDNDPRGLWASDNLLRTEARDYAIFDIVSPQGTKYQPPKGSSWRFNKEKVAELIADNRIWFGEDGNSRPRLKRFLTEVRNSVPAQTIWKYWEVGHSDSAKKDLGLIFSDTDISFATPKPVGLIERILRLIGDKNALVLDSFAGSGTTAHAVLAANQKDGGNRKFILVECEDYADKITAERVRRVIKGYEFTGNQKEELLRKSLTFTDLKKADKLLHEIEGIENLEMHRFDTISKTVKDGMLIVSGERAVKERTEGLGGSFTYCTLGEPLDLDKLLTGEQLPTYEALGAWAFHTATGEAFNPKAMDKKAKWFLGESAGYFVWLVYKPDLNFLKSREAALTLNLAETIAKAKTGKRHLVFAPAKFVPNKTLLPMGVEFAPLPFALYRVEKA
jgi:adenine-specific DNA-methyltransferase